MWTIAFGDSFVKMFTHCSDAVYYKFKGKSLKGLTKPESQNRKRIEEHMQRASKARQVLFMFGQVDFNYVRYYKVIHGEPPIDEDHFHDYVKWVSTLNKSGNISIVSIFPSPITEEYLISSLINKGTYLNEQMCKEVDQRLLQEHRKSEETWTRWNGWIAKYCKQYKVKNLVLFEKNEVPHECRDLSNLTAHLRYIPVLKIVKKHINITFDQEKATKAEKEYEKQKTIRIATSLAMLAQDILGNEQIDFKNQNYYEDQKFEKYEEIATNMSNYTIEGENSTKNEKSSIKSFGSWGQIQQLSPIDLTKDIKNYRKTTINEQIENSSTSSSTKKPGSDSYLQINEQNPKKRKPKGRKPKKKYVQKKESMPKKSEGQKSDHEKTQFSGMKKQRYGQA